MFSAEFAAKLKQRKAETDKHSLLPDTDSSRVTSGSRVPLAVPIPQNSAIVPVPQAKYFERSAEGFCGLRNQGATCYLNSLLQSLYMTPELRQAVYEWPYNDNIPEDKSAPRQFQKLFANMQMSLQGSHSTHGVTKSFGWTSNEVYQQQDVTEMFQVLFEHFRSQKGTSLEKIVEEKYMGESVSYVKCLDCGYTSDNKNPFQVLQLPIEGMKTLEDCINNYTHPEILDGANQYFCQDCNQKCDAQKGIALTRFPYLLSINFNRWTMNWQTMQRKKLGEKIRFPLLLNVKPHLTTTFNDSSNGKPKASPVLMFNRSNKAAEDDAKNSEEKGVTCKKCDFTNPADAASCGFCEVYDEKGDEGYEYELFSMMIHTGGAYGGHYFAYIKDFKTGDWICFNDSRVTRIEEDYIKYWFENPGAAEMDLKKVMKARKEALGDLIPMTNPLAGSYLLMYRQVSNQNIAEADSKLIHDSIIAEIKKKDKVFEKQKARMEYLKTVQKFNIFSGEMKRGVVIEVKKNLLMSDAHKAVYDEFKFENETPIEQTRLREWDSIRKMMLEPIADGEYEKQTIEEMRFKNMANVTLEIRAEDADFEKWEGEKIAIELVTVDEATGSFTEPRYEMVKQNCVISEVRQLVAKLYQADDDQVGLAKLDDEAKYGALLLDKNRLDDYQLKELDYRIYFEIVPKESLMGDNPQTPGQGLLSRFSDMINEITVSFKDLIDSEKTHTVRIDLRKTLGELRDLIARTLDIPLNFCRITRNFKQLKDDEKTLIKLHFDEFSALEGCMLGVTRERVLRKNEFSLSVYELVEAKKKKDRFKFVNEIVLNSTWKAAKVREEIRTVARKTEAKEEAKEEEYPFKDIPFFRIREKKGSRMLGPFMEDQALKKNCLGVRDGYQLVVQPSMFQEIFTKNTLLINVASWDPKELSIGKIVEIGISANAKLETDLKETLSKLSDIPQDKITAVHPYRYQVNQEGKKHKISELFSKAPDTFDPSHTMRTWKMKNADYVVYKDKTEKEIYIPESSGETSVSFARQPERGIVIYSPEEQVEREAKRQKEEADDLAEREKLRQEAIERQKQAEAARMATAVAASIPKTEKEIVVVEDKEDLALGNKEVVENKDVVEDK